MCDKDNVCPHTTPAHQNSLCGVSRLLLILVSFQRRPFGHLVLISICLFFFVNSVRVSQVEISFIKMNEGMQEVGKEKKWNCCWTVLLLEQCRCNLPVQQPQTLSCKDKLIWCPHKFHRVGGYSGVIKVRGGWGASEGVIMGCFSAEN